MKAFVLAAFPLMVLTALFCVSSWASEDQLRFLTEEQHALLDEMFRVHLNYFLSSEATTSFGFALTAYEVGNRTGFAASRRPRTT